MFRTLFYLPVLSSTVATATLWFWILNPQLGLLNGVLGLFGISGKAWLYDSKLAMFSIVLMSLWAGFGGNMMIFLAGLKGIPAIYYEAAQIEGASRWQMFTRITIPSIYHADHRDISGIRSGLCVDEGRTGKRDYHDSLLHI